MVGRVSWGYRQEFLCSRKNFLGALECFLEPERKIQVHLRGYREYFLGARKYFHGIQGKLVSGSICRCHIVTGGSCYDKIFFLKTAFLSHSLSAVPRKDS